MAALLIGARGLICLVLKQLPGITGQANVRSARGRPSAVAAHRHMSTFWFAFAGTSPAKSSAARELLSSIKGIFLQGFLAV